MRKLAGILLALGVVGSPSLAMAADVVTEVCTVNVPKQLLTFIEASPIYARGQYIDNGQILLLAFW
jgi:hypothetical protein